MACLALQATPACFYLNEYSTEQDWEAWGKAMGLDRPLYVQYGTWAGNAARGDLGDSMQHKKPSLSVVYDRLGATLLLAISATALVFLIAVPLGILSAVKRGSAWDYIGTYPGIAGPDGAAVLAGNRADNFFRGVAGNIACIWAWGMGTLHTPVPRVGLA